VPSGWGGLGVPLGQPACQGCRRGCKQRHKEAWAQHVRKPLAMWAQGLCSNLLWRAPGLLGFPLLQAAAQRLFQPLPALPAAGSSLTARTTSSSSICSGHPPSRAACGAPSRTPECECADGVGWRIRQHHAACARKPGVLSSTYHLFHPLRTRVITLGGAVMRW